MRENNRYTTTRGNRGVALVLVLGMLSLMMIIAVAFAVSMRVERMAAGNYAEIVRSRELVHVALARALDRLDTDLGGGMVAGGLVYPAWPAPKAWEDWGLPEDAFIPVAWSTNIPNPTNTVISNTMGIVNNLLVRNTNIYTEGSEFVPDALWRFAEPAASTTEWIWVSTTEVVGPSTNAVTNVFLHGRVAYMILNTSGLLDLNYVGGSHVNGIDRGVGTNVSEIDLSGFVTDVALFTNTRAINGPYLTILEAAEFNAALYWPVTNFVNYSRSFPARYWDGAAQDIAVNLAGDRAQIAARESDIKTKFADIGFAGPTNTILYNALADYVDDDPNALVPSDLDYGTKPVPMINELIFTGVDDGSGNIQELNLEIEVWYPFVTGGGAGFTLEVLQPFAQQWNIPVIDPANPFWVSPSINIASPGAALPYSYALNFQANIKDGAGNIVDSIQGNNVPVTIQLLAPASVSLECLDPRFNHDLNNTALWQSSANSTRMAVNQWTQTYLNDSATDGDTSMYVAQRPLQSIGEIGYLPYAPWKTIKLYGTDRHRVLDVFGLCTNPADTFVSTDAPHRGLVNPNSEITNALAAVFMNMPVDQYPGEPGAERLENWDQALGPAHELIQETFSSGLYTNLSDIGRTDWGSFAPDGISVTNELMRESFVRNTAGLFDVGQNTFTILLGVEVASKDGFARRPVRQNAVATVWRNPYSGKMTVVQLKMLKD